MKINKNISDKQEYRILLTIKVRFQKFGIVGISRLEASKFGISERQMLNLINTLRDSLLLIKQGTTKGNNNEFKCNIYSLSNKFIEMLKGISLYLKKDFNAINIDIIEFIKNKFNCKEKYGVIKFCDDGINYIIQKRGKFKNKIFDTTNNKIVNILYFINN